MPPIWLSKTLNTLSYLFLAVFTQIMLNLSRFGKEQLCSCLCVFANPITAVWYIFPISFILTYPSKHSLDINSSKKLPSGLVVCSVSSFSMLCLAHSTFSFILKLFSSSNSWRSGTFISDFSVSGNTVTDREFVLSKWKKNEWR